jgi:DNA-directed RNA polymerase subunit N (RpoN/RPB10)
MPDELPIMCFSCNKTMDKPKYRYIMQVKIIDHTGILWVTIGDIPAEKIICTFSI